jgi:tripartite-type tricarboxylate transporter receptor subunit TctC
MDKRIFLKTCTSAALGTLGVRSAHSIAPRNLNIIVPFAPQGVSSLLAEALCHEMQGKGWGLCRVEHIPGMTNMVATRNLLKRANDHDITLMIAGPSIFTVGQHLNPYMSIKPLEDLTILSPLMKGPMVLVTSASSGIDSWEKLAALPNPKKCAISGLGSPSHVVAAYIDSALFSLGSAHTSEGDLPGIRQVLNGEMTSAVVSIGSCKGHLDGSLNFIMSSSNEPLVWPDKRQTPTLPSVAKLRHAPDFVFDNWLAIVAPKNMDAELQQTLQQQLMTAKSSALVKQLIGGLLHEPLNMSPTEMMQRLKENTHRWEDYVNRLQLQQALNLNL